ncbi:MAG TPA: hypothetical protein DCW90_20440 [Lachnospiraceae bacterium]|nr:hypothetical protein [Lachnospiraceae bacterium]
MKKVFTFLAALSFMFVFAGCGENKIINEYGEERQVYGDFIEINHKMYNTYMVEHIVYDKNTKVMYLYFDNRWDHSIAMSPYYIIGKNGKPEIGMYGENYEP